MSRFDSETKLAYQDQGFLIVPGAASPEYASLLKAEVLRILEEDAATKASDLGYQRSNRHVRFSRGLHLRSPAILAYIRSEIFVNLARAILGEDAELQFTSTITKSPGKNQEVDWHQDAVFSQDVHDARLICWSSLSDSYPDNGGLFVLPGSHRHGPVPHTQSPRNEFNKIAETDISRAVPVVLRAGDVLVIHPLLVHGSPENKTETDRVALMAGYQLPKPEYTESELKLRLKL